MVTYDNFWHLMAFKALLIGTVSYNNEERLEKHVN